MDLEKTLLNEAQYAVSDLKNRARVLEPQLQEIDKLKLEVEAQCQAARLAPKRLLEYKFQIGTEYQCPGAGSTTSASPPFTPPILRTANEPSCAAKPARPSLSFSRGGTCTGRSENRASDV